MALKILALPPTGESQSCRGIEYAIVTHPPTGKIYVFEHGAQRHEAPASAYAVGDRLRVAVEGGVVKYLSNGTLLYDSRKHPTYAT